MTKNGRLIKFDIQDPFYHLSSLEAVWRELDGSKGPPVLILRCLRPCVLLGASQVARQAVDIDYCNGRGIPIIRRPSEGGTIYADENCLLYSLVMSAAVAEEVFEGFRKSIIYILTDLGLSARAKPPNDIMIDGKKAAGLTVTQWYSVLSFSGTLLLDTDSLRLDRIIGLGTAAKLAGVNQILQDKVKKDALADRIINGAGSLLGISFETAGLTERERDIASELATVKYSNNKWNRIRG